MPLGLSVRVENVDPIRLRIRGLSPQQNPEFVSAAMKIAMNRVLQVSRREYLSGPRPRRLDTVTGELKRSLTIDKGELPFAIEGGTPLEFAPVHEFGQGGRRAFLRPALTEASREFPEIFAKSWIEQLTARGTRIFR